MDIPKYVGVVYVPDAETGESSVDYIANGNDEAAVLTETLNNYNSAVAFYRSTGGSESFISQIGWDVYKSTRATANSPS